jgi:hypothetical protein
VLLLQINSSPISPISTAGEMSQSGLSRTRSIWTFSAVTGITLLAVAAAMVADVIIITSWK